MIESRCGILCSECKDKECKGCVNISNPSWGECEVKACCEQSAHLHCGECKGFPCKLAMDYAYHPKEGDDGKRLEQCRKWKQSSK